MSRIFSSGSGQACWLRPNTNKTHSLEKEIPLCKCSVQTTVALMHQRSVWTLLLLRTSLLSSKALASPECKHTHDSSISTVCVNLLSCRLERGNVGTFSGYPRKARQSIRPPALLHCQPALLALSMSQSHWPLHTRVSKQNTVLVAFVVSFLVERWRA